MIDNKGDETFETDTEVKSISEITGQVSNVNKSLLSVSEIVENGNRVVLDKDGSYNLTKEVVEAVLRYIYVGNLPTRVNTLIPDIFVLAHMWLLYGR